MKMMMIIKINDGIMMMIKICLRFTFKFIIISYYILLFENGLNVSFSFCIEIS